MIGDIQDLHSVQISFRTMPTLHGLQAGHTLRARHGKTISNHPDIVLDITQLLGRVARKESSLCNAAIIMDDIQDLYLILICTMPTEGAP
jgi:hypothetical protein